MTDHRQRITMNANAKKEQIANINAFSLHLKYSIYAHKSVYCVCVLHGFFPHFFSIHHHSSHHKLFTSTFEHRSGLFFICLFHACNRYIILNMDSKFQCMLYQL